MRITLTHEIVEHAMRLYVDVYAAAGALGCSQQTLRRYCHDHGIPVPRSIRNAARVARLRSQAERMDPETMTGYLNCCATPGCPGHPMVDGYCVRCARRLVSA